jgi:hypothetical protein
MMPKSKSVAHVIKCGLIKATVRVRCTKGKFRFSLAIVRLYRDGDCWKESKRFGPDDIPVMRLVLDKAYGWIWMYRQAQQNGLTEVVESEMARS